MGFGEGERAFPSSPSFFRRARGCIRNCQALGFLKSPHWQDGDLGGHLANRQHGVGKDEVIPAGRQVPPFNHRGRRRELDLAANPAGQAAADLDRRETRPGDGERVDHAPVAPREGQMRGVATCRGAYP